MSSNNSQFQTKPLVGGVPKVSIIIPTYNNARFLPEALESVFSQNYADYEVILIDDGSVDETRDVLQRYSTLIRYVFQTNAGSAAARNSGLDLARGEFVVFLDADDLLLPGKLRQQAAYLELRPSLGAVHSGWIIINEANEALRTVEPWQWAPTLDLETWLLYKPVKMGSMMFRRLWIESVGRFDPEFRQAQDFDLLLRLMLQGCRMEWIYCPTLKYRVYPDSTMRKNALQQYQFAMAVLEKFYAYPLLPKDLRERETEIRYHSLVWLGWHLYTCNFNDDMIRPLQEAFACSPWTAVQTIFEIFKVYLHWLRGENMGVGHLQAIWPRLGQASGLESVEWVGVNRFFQWWLGRNPSLEPWRFNDFNLLWSYFETAVRLEHLQTISPEQCLDWWSQVWWYDVNDNKRHAREGLMAHYAKATTAELIDRIQFSLVVGCEKSTLEQLDQFWDDALQLGLISVSERQAIINIYLTFFGQSMLRHNQTQARLALQRVVRLSLHPRSWRAWADFIRKAFHYYLSG